MTRWLLWFALGIVIYIAGTAAYLPSSPLPDAARFFSTIALRGYVYISVIAIAIGVGRWLFRSTRTPPTPPA